DGRDNLRVDLVVMAEDIHPAVTDQVAADVLGDLDVGVDLPGDGGQRVAVGGHVRVGDAKEVAGLVGDQGGELFAILLRRGGGHVEGGGEDQGVVVVVLVAGVVLLRQAVVVAVVAEGCVGAAEVDRRVLDARRGCSGGEGNVVARVDATQRRHHG